MLFLNFLNNYVFKLGILPVKSLETVILEDFIMQSETPVTHTNAIERGIVQKEKDFRIKKMKRKAMCMNQELIN